MELIKRDCNIEMKLIPYGAGWTDVYLNIAEKQLYFIISSAIGHQFNDLLRALYHMYPQQNDYENADDLFEYKFGICEYCDNEYKIKKIVDDVSEQEPPFVGQDIPWKAAFHWDEEGSCSNWVLEREPTEDTDFIIKINIDICRNITESHYFEVRYKDFCYSVAKAYTETLKKYGFFGYHHSVYTDDINIRYLLFLKSVALDNFEAIELTSQESGLGETSSFENELELLLFNM